MKKFCVMFASVVYFTCILSANNVKNNLIMNDTNTSLLSTDSTSCAKETNWNIKNNLLLSMEQSQINNWAAGGYSNFALGILFKGFYNYKKDKHKVDNTVELAYGRTRQDISGKGIMDKTNEWIKSDDKVELNSIYGYQAVRNWNYSGLLNLKTQIDKGYKNNVLISEGFSPAVLTSSIGFEYKIPHFSTLFSFLTGKTTYCYANDTIVRQNIFGTEDWERSWLFAMGSYIKIFYQSDVFKNVNILTKLDLFWDYKKALLDTDISGEVFINMKINKYLTTFIDFQTVIDKDFSTALQYKERFGISISLNW